MIFILLIACIWVGALFHQENLVYFFDGNMVFLSTMLLVFYMISYYVFSSKEKKVIQTNSIFLKTTVKIFNGHVGTGLLFLSGTILLVYAIDAYRAYMVEDMYAQRNLFAFLAVVIIGCGLFFLNKYREGKLSEQEMVWLVFGLGLVIRIIYLLYTPITERQNDIGNFSDDNTLHLGYIYHIFTHGKLPEGDPRNALQFYNPPLYYVICAVWLKIQTVFGVGLERALENLQLLTLFYSGCIMIVADKIALKLGLNGGYRIISMSLVAFTPYFFMGAGAVNQDTLLTLWMLLAIYTTLYWMEKPCIKRVLLIAITLGLGMMTKITAGILALPIGVMFIWMWISNRKDWKKYMTMYGVFSIVIFPLALWFPVKNYLLYRMPFVWSPPTSGMEQYTGDYPWWQHFIDFSPIQFKTLCISWHKGFWEGADYIEHNIPLAFVKHLAFSDWPYCMYTSLYYLISAVLLLMVGCVIGACVILLVYWLKKGSESIQIRSFILLTVITSVASYLYFCFSKPFVAAMNVRYGLPLVVLLFVGGNLGLQKLLQNKTGRKQLWIKKILGVTGLFYGAVSIGLFCLFMIKA